MLVLLLLVSCVCFHVACVMYLQLTSVQVGPSQPPPQQLQLCIYLLKEVG